MESRAKLLGHPVHPMLVALPIGLLVGAVAFDIVYLITGTAEWTLVSYWTMAGGILTGLLAAIPGIIDYRSIPRGTRARRIGFMHGAGNVVVIVLFAASWLSRAEGIGPGAGALVLSFAAVGLVLVTGWLGGELVDRLGMGVDDGAHLNAPSSLSGKPAGEGTTSGPRRAA